MATGAAGADRAVGAQLIEGSVIAESCDDLPHGGVDQPVGVVRGVDRDLNRSDQERADRHPLSGRGIRAGQVGVGAEATTRLIERGEDVAGQLHRAIVLARIIDAKVHIGAQGTPPSHLGGGSWPGWGERAHDPVAGVGAGAGRGIERGVARTVGAGRGAWVARGTGCVVSPEELVERGAETRLLVTELTTCGVTRAVWVGRGAAELVVDRVVGATPGVAPAAGAGEGSCEESCEGSCAGTSTATDSPGPGSAAALACCVFCSWVVRAAKTVAAAVAATVAAVTKPVVAASTLAARSRWRGLNGVLIWSSY